MKNWGLVVLAEGLKEEIFELPLERLKRWTFHLVLEGIKWLIDQKSGKNRGPRRNLWPLDDDDSDDDDDVAVDDKDDDDDDDDDENDDDDDDVNDEYDDDLFYKHLVLLELYSFSKAARWWWWYKWFERRILAEFHHCTTFDKYFPMFTRIFYSILTGNPPPFQYSSCSTVVTGDHKNLQARKPRNRIASNELNTLYNACVLEFPFVTISPTWFEDYQLSQLVPT